MVRRARPSGIAVRGLQSARAFARGACGSETSLKLGILSTCLWQGTREKSFREVAMRQQHQSVLQNGRIFGDLLGGGGDGTAHVYPDTRKVRFSSSMISKAARIGVCFARLMVGRQKFLLSSISFHGV